MLRVLDRDLLYIIPILHEKFGCFCCCFISFFSATIPLLLISERRVGLVPSLCCCCKIKLLTLFGLWYLNFGVDDIDIKLVLLSVLGELIGKLGSDRGFEFGFRLGLGLGLGLGFGLGLGLGLGLEFVLMVVSCC